MRRLGTIAVAACLLALLGAATAFAEAPVDARSGASESEGEPPALLVDLNSASASELEQLPGIGPSRALAIIAFRETHGGFTQVGQLMRIKGIGRAMLRKLRPFVTLGAAAGPTAPTADAGTAGRDRVP